MGPLAIVLGLGNPGEHYRDTRHNLGFRVVDRLAPGGAGEFRIDTARVPDAEIAEFRVAGGSVVLAKPRTYMNRSGRAAAALCRGFGAEPGSLIVVYDDADLDLGRVRIRPSGSAGGHNGLRSMIEVLETGAFARVRLGVRGSERGDGDLASYVLAPFDPDERPVAEALVDLGADAVLAVVENGVIEAMNEYNGRRVWPAAEDSDGEP